MNLSLTQILNVVSLVADDSFVWCEVVRVGMQDERNQIIHLNMWVYQEWRDPNFHWTPAYYGGVTELLVPQDELWKPDLVLYNK